MFILPFSQTALGQTSCSANDAACLAALAGNIAESNSNQATLGLIAAAAAGYGIYKLTSSEDTPEEANLRAQEMSNGYGLRLNNINAPIRISTMRPASYNALGQAKADDENQSNLRLNMLSVEYIW